MGTGMPAIGAFTTWLCLKMWGVTFLRESFCQAFYCPKHRIDAQVSGAPAREELHLARLQALQDSLLIWPDYRVMTLDS
jgi:hypothetical protein